MMTTVQTLQYEVLKLLNRNIVDIFTLTSQLINNIDMQHTVYETHLISFAIRTLLTDISISLSYIPLQSVGNKTFYGPRRFLQSNVYGIDISTCRLWYAMLMTKLGHYRLSLRIVNKVLSNISPFALYYSGLSLHRVYYETKEQYVDMFSRNDTRVIERARRAWMFDLQIRYSHMDMVPAAIQVELLQCDKFYGLCLSPFVCAYYLIFLYYSGLRQYDNRDRALRQLIDVVNNQEQRGHYNWHSYNIAGHCLLSVGQTDKAREMFMGSYQLTLPGPLIHQLTPRSTTYSVYRILQQIVDKLNVLFSCKINYACI